MNANILPMLGQLKDQIKDQIKNTLSSREQLRDTLMSTAKEIYNQTKDSKLVTQYIVPAVESEKAEQALKRIDEKLASHPVLKNAQPVLKKVGEYREAFIREMSSKKPQAQTSNKGSEDHSDVAPTKIPRTKRTKTALKSEETH